MKGLIMLSSLFLIIAGLLFSAGASTPTTVDVPVSYAIYQPTAKVALAGNCANGVCSLAKKLIIKREVTKEVTATTEATTARARPVLGRVRAVIERKPVRSIVKRLLRR